MDHTDNTKGRRTPKGASSRGVWVKPGGPEARADLSVSRHPSEILMSQHAHSTTPNRPGTDPYAGWCGRGCP
jgi:hypothetical protein